MDLFLCKTYRSDDKQYLEKRLWEHISCSINFRINDININLVMVNCAIPSLIAQFDFKFNRVYYDLYSVYAFDWDAIRNRQSIHDCYRVRYYCSRGDKYFANIDRVKKYIEREFIVTKCPDKEILSLMAGAYDLD